MKGFATRRLYTCKVCKTDQYAYRGKICKHTNGILTCSGSGNSSQPPNLIEIISKEKLAILERDQELTTEFIARMNTRGLSRKEILIMIDIAYGRMDVIVEG